MKATDMALVCPHCGREQDKVATMCGHAKPKPRDISLCGHCAGVCMFAPTMTLIPLTGEHLADMPAQLRWQVEALKRMLAARRPS